MHVGCTCDDNTLQNFTASASIEKKQRSVSNSAVTLKLN